MSFIQRELDRLNSAILLAGDGEQRERLYAAQQALAWATEPDGYKSPLAMVMGTQEGSADCSAVRHPTPSSDICFQSDLPQPQPIQTGREH